MRLMSIDAETNGLWGEAFSIGAVIMSKEGDVIETIAYRCPIKGRVNEFVQENVLPEMEELPITHKNYYHMLTDFMLWYKERKEDCTVIVHMGLPVEAKLFIDARSVGIIGEWEAPYPLVDISALPEIGTSVDTYNKTNGIEVLDLVGGTHNPLYDSVSAALAYIHWLETYRGL